jgi:hypothetical protein
MYENREARNSVQRSILSFNVNIVYEWTPIIVMNSRYKLTSQ